MVSMQLKQSPNKTFSELLYFHLDKRGWTPGRLASNCGINRSTLSRILNGKGNNGNPYSPTPESVMIMTRAMRLSEQESKELFYAAFPQWRMWEEAIQHNYDLIETDMKLEEANLPLLSKE